MAVVTTNLETQIQSRIDNLSGSETLSQLLVLRKAADNLDLNLTDIDTAISAKIASFDGGTADEDLLIANRAASLAKESREIRYRLTEIVSGDVPVGASGIALAVTRPNAASKLVIKYLMSKGSSGPITLEIDGVIVVSKTLGLESTSLNESHFYLMEISPGNISQPSSYKGVSSPIECNSFTLSRNNGSTGITYKYEIWEQYDA